MRRIPILCLALLFVLSARVSAQTGQQPVPPDSTGVAAPDSTETITYSAETITYDVDDSTLILTGNATVRYRTVTLKAGRILFNTQNEILTAESVQDSTEAQVQQPTLEDAQGTLVGDRMMYGIKTQRGRILRGQTQYNEGFFSGDQLRVGDENILRVDHGSYSTCDLPDHKHYWLSTKQAKVIPNDKAIVKDMVAYVYGVPVFYMPFYVLPLKRGRHSGFTTPNYGTSASQGTYVRNIGYYWAASDYWDMKLTGDFSANDGVLIRPGLRYAVAGRLRGDFRASYSADYDLSNTGWDLTGSHWQQLRPDLQVSGQAQFANQLSYVQSTTRGYDPGRLQRSLRSNMSVDKRWGQSSMNLSVTESSPDGDLIRPTTTLNFRLPTRSLAPQPERRRFTGGVPDLNPPPPAEPSWLQSVLYGYNIRLQDQRVDTVTTRQDVSHRFNVSSQQTFGGWLKFQPIASYNENWIHRTDDGFDRNNAYTAGVSTNTTLYGLFEPNIGSLQAVRHVMTPSLSFSQSGPGTVSRSVNFSLNNILQAKTLKDERERKFDLLYLNTSTGYNFEAATRPLSDLRTTIRMPNRTVNVDAALTHDFYAPQDNSFRFPWIKRTTITTSLNFRGGSGPTPGAPADPLQTGAPGQSGFDDPARGTSGYGADRFDEQFNQVLGPWSVALSHRYSVSRNAPAAEFLTTSHLIRASNRFNLDGLMATLGMATRLTRKWRVEHSINYDIRTRSIDAHNFNFYRNLHCWELFIRWTPTGFNQGIYFRLNIRAHPEIKIEQQRLSG